MLISQVPQNPLDDQSLLQFDTSSLNPRHSPPDTIWHRMFLGQSQSSEGRSSRGCRPWSSRPSTRPPSPGSACPAPAGLLSQSAEERPCQIGIHQFDSVYICVTLVKRCFVILPIPAPQSRALALPGPPSTYKRPITQQISAEIFVIISSIRSNEYTLSARKQRLIGATPFKE